jgi:hypothetical protein
MDSLLFCLEPRRLAATDRSCGSSPPRDIHGEPHPSRVDDLAPLEAVRPTPTLDAAAGKNRVFVSSNRPTSRTGLAGLYVLVAGRRNDASASRTHR